MFAPGALEGARRWWFIVRRSRDGSECDLELPVAIDLPDRRFDEFGHAVGAGEF